MMWYHAWCQTASAMVFEEVSVFLGVIIYGMVISIWSEALSGVDSNGGMFIGV